MQILKKIKLEPFLLLIMLVFMAGYHFFLYFNSPWDKINNSILQIRNDSLIVIGCSFLSFLLMVILIAFRLFKKNIPSYLFILTLILIIFGLFWILYSIMFNNISLTLLLRDSFPPMAMITCGIILVGYNNKWWSLLKKMLLIFSCFFVFYSFYEVIRAYSIFGFDYRITSGAPMYLFIVGLYATYGVVVLTDEWKKKYKALMFILIVILFFNSAILQGRSWFLQMCILFFIYLIRIYSYLKKHNKGLQYFIPSLIILFILVIFVSKIELFEGLIFRFETSGDTRTHQLEAFFSQVSFKELFLGGGIRASYSFNGDPNYHFIDNQVLLFAFRYGLIPTFVYLMLYFVLFIKTIKTKNRGLLVKMIVLFSWLLAMIGLSVYFNLGFGMPHTLMMLYVGRLYYEVDKFYKKDEKNEKNIIYTS